MPKYFSVSFTDADTLCNQVLNDYEEQQFFNPDREAVIRLAKTEEQGDLYSDVLFNDQTFTYPKPFLFTVQPDDHHQNRKQYRAISKVLCLYDNAGESFLPGRDQSQNPVTRHLTVSKSILFCFDPTQDPRFREAVGKHRTISANEESVSARQEIVLHEIINRIQRHQGHGPGDKVKTPVLILCTKFDFWKSILGREVKEYSYLKSHRKTDKTTYSLDIHSIQDVSDATRKLIWKFSPELVTAAESFSTQVYFIPVSATGGPPVKDESKSNFYGVRPKDIKPFWCEVPILLSLALNVPGLLPQTVGTKS